MMHPRRSRKKLLLVLTIALFSSFVLLTTGSASAQVVITVPGDQPTIQSAIDAAAPGDTVLVAPGTYFENINFRGKAITVESEQGPEVTIIDGNLAGPVAIFTSGEGRASILRGFTLQRGDAGTEHGFDGGGVRIDGSSPTVQGNIITNNRACSGGGGIDADFSSALIEGNRITNNVQFGCSGGPGGGGISVGGEGQTEVIDNVIVGNSWDSSSGGGITLFAAGAPTIMGNVIRANSVYDAGGGIWIVNHSDALIVQNLIVDNRAARGGGIYWSVPSGNRGPLVVNNTIARNQGQGSGIFAAGFDAQVQLFNNIVVGASGLSAIYCDQFYDPSPPVLRSNNVFSPGAAAYGGTCGDPTGTNGNISADPLFVDATTNDYHLGPGSPSIDAGDNTAPDLPATDIDGDQRIINGQVDQGVDEYSVSVRPPDPPTDLTATRDHKSAIVSWSPPSTDGGSPVLSYTVSVSDGRTVTVDASVTSVTFDGIKKKQTYTFSVVATNAIGSSDPASVTLPAD
jgi:nitrous oxidase accessory protein NosD